jgi:hypothetical protein
MKKEDTRMSDDKKTEPDDHDRRLEELEVDFMRWRARIAQGRTKFNLATREMASALTELVALRLEVIPTGDSAMSTDISIAVTINLSAADLATIRTRRMAPPDPPPAEPPAEVAPTRPGP